jgi:hypothetical protein
MRRYPKGISTRQSRAWDSRSVASQAASAKTHRKAPALLVLPLLDNMRDRVLDWVDELELQMAGKGAADVRFSISNARESVVRVRGSMRHQRLAEFLSHALVALDHEQPESARYILLTAMAFLGWPATTR